MKDQGHGHRWTEAQYLAFGRHSEDKHEYRDGEVVAVPPSSTNHVRLMGKVGASLDEQLHDTSYEAMMGQMRVRVPDGSFYGYPDLLMVGEPICTDKQEDTLTNPFVIVEILSRETEAFDRSGKFSRYRQIPTLRDYVLIAQDRMRIEHFARQSEDTWILAAVKTGNEELSLDSIGCRLKLSEIYERVQFAEADEPEDEPTSEPTKEPINQP